MDAAVSYTVNNNAKYKIYVRDGSWRSDEIKPGGSLKVTANGDVDVTVVIGEGRNKDIGRVWIPVPGSITVKGEWDWCIAPPPPK